MNQYRGLRINIHQISQAFGLELLMNDTGAVPHHHIRTGLTLDIATQIFIRRPENFLSLVHQMLGDLQSDTGSHYPICTGLDCR